MKNKKSIFLLKNFSWKDKLQHNFGIKAKNTDYYRLEIMLNRMEELSKNDDRECEILN